MDRLRRLLPPLDGPPIVLPAALDRLAEAWWRFPPRGRLLAGGAAVVALLVVTGLGAARSPWGQPTTVHVATRDLPPGHRLGPDDLRPVSWPAAIAPPVLDAVGRRLGSGLPAGAAVTPGHLASTGAAATLPSGRVAVAVSVDALPPVAAGQRVDLLAGGMDGRGEVLAAAARVLAVDATTVLVAVDRDAAPAVAGAAATGQVTAALLPSPG